MALAAARSDKRRQGQAAGLRNGGLRAAGKKILVDVRVVLTAHHSTSILSALNRTANHAQTESSDEGLQRHHPCRSGSEVMEALIPL